MLLLLKPPRRAPGWSPSCRLLMEECPVEDGGPGFGATADTEESISEEGAAPKKGYGENDSDERGQRERGHAGRCSQKCRSKQKAELGNTAGC